MLGVSTGNIKSTALRKDPAIQKRMFCLRLGWEAQLGRCRIFVNGC